MKKYNKQQKESYIQGKIVGYKLAMQNCNAKRKGSFTKRKNNDLDWKVAQAYAEHMGVKFSLNDSEIKKNTKEHYARMKKDSQYKESLYEEYVPGYWEKKHKKDPLKNVKETKLTFKDLEKALKGK